MTCEVHSGRMPLLKTGPMLLIHGGAWAIPDDECTGYRDGLEEALKVGIDLLRQGASALEVVSRVVMTLEDNGSFDAGRGSVLTRSQEVAMDAGIMRGNDEAFGSVALVQGVRNPIQAARHLLEGDGSVRFMAGQAVRSMAAQAGLPVTDPAFHIGPREQQRFQEIAEQQGHFHVSQTFTGAHPTGTVGCVCRDAGGDVAAATSTGGTPYRPDGRIGDSPLPGCGFFAQPYAAASATGWGEAIAGSNLCARACFEVHTGSEAETSGRKVMADMNARYRGPDGQGARGGLILISKDGQSGWAWTSPRMARAGWQPGTDPWFDV